MGCQAGRSSLHHQDLRYLLKFYLAHCITHKRFRSINNEEFPVWFNDAKIIAESVGSQVSKTRAVGRQRHRANAESETDEEYFRRNLAIPFCDFF
jgi:hypothetical protein